MYGPTGPAYPVVLQVPSVGTHINLNESPYAALKYAADHSIPMMMGADNSAIAYNWSMVGSGLSADPNMAASGATGVNQCGAIYANTRLDSPEMAPQGANGIVVRPILAGASAMLRIWRTG